MSGEFDLGRWQEAQAQDGVALMEGADGTPVRWVSYGWWADNEDRLCELEALREQWDFPCPRCALHDKIFDKDGEAR